MPMMSRHLDEDDDAVLPSRRSSDREMTLGTGAILGIFFGLVVLLGAFFGFGYKMGSSAAKGTTQAAVSDSAAPAEASNPEKFSSFKPSAASPAAVSSSSKEAAESGPPALTPPPGNTTTVHVSQPSVGAKPEVLAPAAAAAPLPATITAASNGALAATGIYVQVSAASRKETADLLIKDLHDKGITAVARSVAGDNFIHVQVGPFANKKDAEAMKERIVAAGYNNPILK